jgi:carboxyl-terminal processing protease
MEVVPGTPAAQAGLAVGDRIVAVDGKTPAKLSLPDLRLKLREAPAGTPVELRIQRGGDERNVRMVLKDLV